MNSMHDIEVSIFSGGRGTKNIYNALQGVPLTINFLINGYDSGLSTGRARWAFDGLLGPSDYRKTLSTILAGGSQSDKELSLFLENRTFLDSYIQSGTREREKLLAKSIPGVRYDKGRWIENSLNYFAETRPVKDKSLNLKDFSVGNAIFCSAFVQNSNDFNSALDEICDELLGQNQVNVVNVTDGADLWIVGISGNQICVDEGFLVNHPPKQPIDKIILVERDVVQGLWSTHSDWTDASVTLKDSLIQASVQPIISSKAQSAISQSSLIVYGSGTLHSSLLPSFLTKNLGADISRNSSARKIFFVNGDRDSDFAASERQSSLLTKTVETLSVNKVTSIITDVFITNLWPQDDSLTSTLTSQEYNDINILRGSINFNNRYSENDAYSAFSSILSELSGRILAPSDSVISIVAPTLNEASKLPSFLGDFIPYMFDDKWACEKILIDGGSNDDSMSILRLSDSYSLLTLGGNPNLGRFSAIKTGILAARGKFVVVFHTDAEYSIKNLDRLINAVTANPDALIVGSRTTNGYGALGLRAIYGEDRTLYWVSRIGGVILAALVTLRLGRPISDPFCGIIAGNRDLLRKVTPSRGNIDAQIKIFYECKKRGIPLIEVPLEFVPRSKLQGKKTDFRMGVKAITTALFYYHRGV